MRGERIGNPIAVESQRESWELCSLFPLRTTLPYSRTYLFHYSANLEVGLSNPLSEVYEHLGAGTKEKEDPRAARCQENLWEAVAKKKGEGSGVPQEAQGSLCAFGQKEKGHARG